MCTRRFVLAPFFFFFAFSLFRLFVPFQKKLQILLSSRSSIDRSPYAAVRRALCKRFVRCTRADTENGRIRIDCPNDVGNASKRAMVATNGFQGARIKVNVIRFLSFLLSLTRFFKPETVPRSRIIESFEITFRTVLPPINYTRVGDLYLLRARFRTRDSWAGATYGADRVPPFIKLFPVAA